MWSALPRPFATRPAVPTARAVQFYGLLLSGQPFLQVDNLVWAKLAYEGLGLMFASGALGRKLENVQLRIGAPREIEARTFFPDGPGTAGDAVGYKRDLGAYLSRRDLQQLVAKSLDTPSIDDEHGVPFQIFYGISGNARAFWSIVNARAVIGYAPDDDAEVKFEAEIRQYLTRPSQPPA